MQKNRIKFSIRIHILEIELNMNNYKTVHKHT